MKKPRGFIWGLALAALLGLSARQAQAGDLIITVSWMNGSTPMSLDISQGTVYDSGSSDANNVHVNIAAVNADLTGSGFNFSDLGASSNNPGDPTGANVKLTGTVVETGGSGATDITITAHQDGFTSPTGPGTLTNASGGTYTDATAGSTPDTTVISTTVAGTTLSSTYAYTGASNPESYSNQPGIATAATAPGTYSMSDTVVITMANTGLNTTSNQFTVSGIFTAVPEPASIVMMVTGMPLPLVVLGLLRRRRAAA